MEVTATATCRVAAPRRAFVFIFVFVKALPPMWRCWECRDVGRPAPCLLLLLLGTQMQWEGSLKFRLWGESPPFTPSRNAIQLSAALLSVSGPQGRAQRSLGFCPRGSPAQWEDR